MAADEFLLTCNEPLLRFYGWENPSLSFGRGNFTPVGLDSQIIGDHTIDKVKRLSGGKTVFHQFELTYSFACDSDLFPPSILETYRLISQPLAAAIGKYGLDSWMKKADKRKISSSICFQEVSSYELTVGPKKIVGSAQYRRRRRFFQHGSILLKIDWDYWKSIWRIPHRSNQLEQRITSFYDELGSFPAAGGLATTIQNEYWLFFETSGIVKDFSASEMEIIRGLQKKYVWNGFA